jgi:3-oxosteroid 1-dehydrogenase
MAAKNDDPCLDGTSRVSRRGFIALGGVTLAASGATVVGAVHPIAETRTCDIVVVGSGASGTSAAITAAAEGAKVVLLEKAPVLGGTSAKSGGGFWIPNNSFLRREGREDPRQDFLSYCAQYSFPHLFDPQSPTLGLDQNSHDLIAAFYDNAAPMLDRMIELGAISVSRGNGEPLLLDYGVLDGFNKVPSGRGLFPRREDGTAGFGAELMRRMLQRAKLLGVEMLVQHEATRLLQDASGAVTGIETKGPDGLVQFTASRGVIFGSGGFTYNRQLLNLHMKEPIYGGCGVPTNTGDFVGIAGSVGAKLGNMAGAWRSQIILEEAIQYVTVPSPMWIPPGDSMIMVNRHGRRFVNEKRNYHDRSRAQGAYDANVPEFPNQLSFVLYDQRTAELFAGVHPFPSEPEGSDFVIKADNWQKMAEVLGARLENLASVTGGVMLSPDFTPNLAGTIARFNGFAASGRDEDFRRGDFRYDLESAAGYSPRQSNPRWPKSGPNPVMFPLAESGPYYAIITAPGTLDTNGGPVIDRFARVLRHDGQPIAGLYGAGNCIASPSHDAYYAAGITLGLGLTFGHIAARHALGEA